MCNTLEYWSRLPKTGQYAANVIQSWTGMNKSDNSMVEWSGGRLRDPSTASTAEFYHFEQC